MPEGEPSSFRLTADGPSGSTPERSAGERCDCPPPGCGSGCTVADADTAGRRSVEAAAALDDDSCGSTCAGASANSCYRQSELTALTTTARFT